jgi:polyhydroxyalkanoate synthesis regulator phasin
MEEQEELFNVDFNLISDEEIDTSSMMEGVSEEKEEIELEEAEPKTPEEPAAKEPEEEKEEEEDKIEIMTAEDSEDEEEELADKEKSPGNDGGDSSPVIPFASLLHEKGLLSELDTEAFAEAVAESDDPFGVLTAAMQKEMELANAKFINSFPPDLIDMAMAVAQGVPYEALKGHKLQEINYSKITDDSISESEDLQKKIVADLYTAKGFKEARVNKLVETLGDSGALEDEAKEAVKELTAIAKERQDQIKRDFADQQKNMSDQYAAQIESIGKNIDDTEEIIPGIKLTKNTKDKLFNNMTKVVGNDENGNAQNYIMSVRQKDPVNFDKTVAYLADITKGFTDWSKIKKSAKSSATADLEKVLSKKSNSYKTGSHKKATPRTEQAEDALIDSLAGMFNVK